MRDPDENDADRREEATECLNALRVLADYAEREEFVRSHADRFALEDRGDHVIIGHPVEIDDSDLAALAFVVLEVLRRRRKI